MILTLTSVTLTLTIYPEINAPGGEAYVREEREQSRIPGKRGLLGAVGDRAMIAASMGRWIVRSATPATPSECRR